jgi:hypothetical protein
VSFARRARSTIEQIKKALKGQREAFRDAFGHTPELVVGILKMGGHGDFLQQLVFAKAVRKRWGAKRALLVLFSRALSPTMAEVAGQPHEDHVAQALFENAAAAMRLGPIVNMPIAVPSWRAVVPALRGLVDCLWDVQYVAASYWRDLRRHAREQLEFDSRLKFYSRFYSGFPSLSNPELHGLGMSQWDLLRESTGLDVREDDLLLTPPDIEAVVERAGDYATIHNGAGGHAVLKRMPPAQMDAVAAALARRGLKVVQLGKKHDAKEPPVLGAQDLRGIPMRMSMGILAKARLHVDVEGGLVYVAKGLGVPRAVFIGPTSPHVFGFADSHNLFRTGEDACSCFCANPFAQPRCTPCWWRRPLWDLRCSKGLPYCGNFPASPEQAAGWIERVLDDMGIVTRDA